MSMPLAQEGRKERAPNTPGMGFPCGLVAIIEVISRPNEPRGIESVQRAGLDAALPFC